MTRLLRCRALLRLFDMTSSDSHAVRLLRSALLLSCAIASVGPGTFCQAQSSSSEGSASITYTYDAAGNLISESGTQNTDTVYNGTGGSPTSVTFHGTLAQYSITTGNQGVTVIDSVAGRDGTSVLINVALMIFSDQSVVDVDSSGASVARLYPTILGRRPDASGLVYYAAEYKAGTTLLTIAQGFLGSPEYTAKYPNYTNNQYVTQLYNNALNRSPSSSELTYYVNELAAGTASRAQIAVNIAGSAECISDMSSWVLIVSGTVNV